MAIEMWKPISGYEGWYEVSNWGRVKTLGRPGRGHTPKDSVKEGFFNRDGYKRVVLSIERKAIKTKFIHQLVATAFIPNLEGKDTVNNINGIKTDNRVENLEWNTRAENNIHAYGLGLKNSAGSNNYMAKIDEAIALEIYHTKGVKNRVLAKRYNLSDSIISRIKLGKTWNHVTHHIRKSAA